MVSAILYVDDNLASGPFPYGASMAYTPAVYAYVPSLEQTYRVLDDINNDYSGYPSSTQFYSTSTGFLFEGSWTDNGQLISVGGTNVSVLDEDRSGNPFYPEEYKQKFVTVNGETTFLAFSANVPDDNLRSTIRDDGGNALFITDGTNAPRTLFNASTVEDVYQLGDDRFVVETLRYDWSQEAGEQQIWGTYLVNTSANATLLTSTEWPDEDGDVREPFQIDGAFVFQGQDYMFGNFGGSGSDYSAEDIFRIDASDGRIVKTGLVNQNFAATSNDADILSVYVPDNNSGYFYYLVHAPSAAQLYRSDGTTQGTVELWNSNDYGLGSGSALRLAATVGNRVIFGDPLSNFVLSTDGTSAGTYDIAGEGTPVGWLRLSNEDFVTVGNNAFFTSGDEIYMTDGTVGGTRIVFEAPEHLSDVGIRSDIRSLHSVDGALYFIADYENDGDYELWSLDSNGSNARIVSVVESGTGEYDRNPYIASAVDLPIELLAGKAVVTTPITDPVTGTDASETVTGSDTADSLDALGGDDVLNGLGGGDFLTGGPGNDTIDGGAGTDTAVFSGARSDYTVFTDSAGRVVVSDGAAGRDGTDVLTNIENLNFGGTAVPVEQALNDRADSDGSPYEVFRFFNTLNGTHFFTTSIEERDALINYNPIYSFEGNTFDSNATAENGGAPVFRFFNSQNGVHFYTASAEEAANIRSNLPQFNDEGIVYYAHSTAGSGGTALFRFFNTDNGSHFFTTSEVERDNIISTLGHYNYEGIAYYVDVA